MLDVVSAGMSELTRGDAIASEAAAFTIEELREQLDAAGFADLRVAHSTPFRVRQIHWAPSPAGPASTSGTWVARPLPREAAVLARLQRYKGLPAH